MRINILDSCTSSNEPFYKELGLRWCKKDGRWEGSSKYQESELIFMLKINCNCDYDLESKTDHGVVLKLRDN